MVSASSVGSSTLLDSTSHRTTSTLGAQQNQYRKFTSAVGKPGQAKETREAVSRIINSANPTRKSPISIPLDYEKFVTEKSAQLENDRHRDLLLFPRDDFTEVEVAPVEKTVVAPVTAQHLQEAQWLLTKDALRLYSSPYKIIQFNYSEYSGDFKKIETSQNFSYLKFETDIALEEEKAANGQYFPTDVIKEGYLWVLPGDSSFGDVFRSEKKRYCVLRRQEDGRIFMEISKQPQQQVVQSQIEIKNAMLRTTKKGKTVLQVSPTLESSSNDKKALIFAGDADSDLPMWLLEIDRALAWNSKDDTTSLGSSGRGTSAEPLGPESESLCSEDSGGSYKDPNSGMIWRGRNAAAKALQPPIVERRNLFSLYWDLEPIQPPSGEPCTLLSKTKLPTSNPTSPIAGPPTPLAEITTKSASSLPTEPKENAKFLYIVKFNSLNLKLSIAQGPTRQFEPFFVRFFLFDNQSCSRVSEEFRITASTDELNSLLNEGQRTTRAGSNTSSGQEQVINGIRKSTLMHQAANQMIYTIANPHPDIWLVVRIEKILSDIPNDIYSKAVESKSLIKYTKSLHAAWTKLSKYRTLLAWAAKPIFEESRTKDSSLNLFKCDDRLTDLDLQKYLSDFAKTQAKIPVIPNATLNITSHITSSSNVNREIAMRISPSLLPLRPWSAPMDSPIPPAFELQHFGDSIQEPYSDFVNLLYVYPMSLSYGSQKVFSRARNIACDVRFVGSVLRRGEKAKAIINRTDPTGPFVQSFVCSVQYHEQYPQFCDEIKVQLPVALDPTDHLLFSFTHISVNNALSPKNQNEPIEKSVGYAWLPLARNENFLIMNEDIQEFDLPVAENLPPGYIKLIPSSKGPSSSEIKWVENGRPLFRVRLRVVSSVFTSEDSLQGFFQSCQRLLQKPRSDSIDRAKTGTPEPAASTAIKQSNMNLNRSCSPIAEHSVEFDEKRHSRVSQKADDLLKVDINRLIPFLHIILGRLFALLTSSASDSVAINALNAIVGIADKVNNDCEKGRLLKNFIRLHFQCTTSDDETTHGALCKYIPLLLRNVQGDLLAQGPVFRQMWFLIDVMCKSMALWLIEKKLYKAPRRERFPPELLFRIENFVESLIQHIIAKHRDLPSDSRSANVALAYFLRFALSFTDRHAILNQIHFVADSLDRNESRALRVYKLELLQVLVGHEHWLPLCLPLLTDKHNGVMRSDSICSTTTPTITSGNENQNFLMRFLTQIFAPSPSLSETSDIDKYTYYMDHFYLSEVYCRMHFPVGILLQELLASLRDTRDYRRQVFALIRNTLAKHSGDSRYSDTTGQSRIATLYAPLIRVALENIRELDATAKVSDSPDLSPVGGPGSKSLKFRSYSSAIDWRTSIVSSTNFGYISGTNLTQLTTTSLPGASINGSSIGGDTKSRASILPSSVSGREKVNTSSISMATLAEKLDKTEARDLLLSILYILKNLPKNTLGALWCAQEANSTGNSNGFVDFIHLLDLALYMFRYRGRSYHIKQQAKRQKSQTKVNINVQPTPLQERSSSISFAPDSQRSSTIDSQASSTISTEPPSGISLATLTLEEDIDISTTPLSFLQESNLIQEVALVILDAAQTLSNQLASRYKHVNSDSADAAFMRLLQLQLRLLDDNWPEAVRLHALAALAMFINIFQPRFFQNGPLECLSMLIEAVLLQLNSRLVRVQHAAAALLQLILRYGYDAAAVLFTKQAEILSVSSAKQRSSPLTGCITERLGRPGAQTGVALAKLLGRNAPLANSIRFERGLTALEHLVSTYSDKKASIFERAVLELIKQLRGVREATGALSEAVNDPIRLAELHIQLANSYRGSAALRCAWFDTLAEAHNADRWYSEATVCQAHCVAIIGKELAAKGLIKVDWILLDVINDQIAKEENAFEDQLDSTQQAGYTLESFTAKIDKTIQTLVLSERYEAVGPLCRMVIPIFEKQHDYKSLVSIYAELQQASSRAAEIKASGKRHLGAYFRVVFHGAAHFREEDKTEWVYREPGLTSLAEACERMIESIRHALGHDHVEVLPENQIDLDKLKSSVAYIQMTHVEPFLGDPDNTQASAVEDPMNYMAHTNIRRFFYEEAMMDESVAKDAPEQARLSLRRVYLTVENAFPNTRRRQRVIKRKERILNPLELACDSLHLKAAQIRKILNAAGIRPGSTIDKSALRRLDLKGLQCFLQGSVSPTVNVGVLAYAEAFTSPAQKDRYGQEGMAKLITAFKVLMTELYEALKVNEAAIGADQQEYQNMMKNSFDGMLERLSSFFNGENFIMKPEMYMNGHLDMDATPRSSMHILDTISGLNGP
uniref:Uncharacterized protein n=1 Tax=Acrobeloides nanus TaxID=290746 RepID=A0A914CQ09_9BILA